MTDSVNYELIFFFTDDVLSGRLVTRMKVALLLKSKRKKTAESTFLNRKPTLVKAVSLAFPYIEHIIKYIRLFISKNIAYSSKITYDLLRLTASVIPYQ